MIRRPPRSTLDRSSAASDVYKRQYLNWRYFDPPHVRYAAAALKRQGEVHGYAVYRHIQEPLGRVTLIVDFLTHPDDISGLKTLLRWVDRAARAEDTDKVRCYT